VNASSRVTVDEIAADLSLGRLRIYAMLEQHIIPNIRVGRTYLVTRHAYEEWKRTCGTAQSVPGGLHVH
jgi:excisionase family DNA binding protein